MTSVGIYGDENGSSRVGLRQTNLSSQLENNKKYKNKTKSVMINAALSMSKNSLLDNNSLHSHHTNASTEMLNFMTSGNSNGGSHNTIIPSSSNYNNNNNNNDNFYNQHTNGSFNQLPPKSSNQRWQNNQGYNQHPNQQYGQGYNNYNQYQNQQYPANNQRQHHDNKTNYRESYMYLNNYDTNHEQDQHQQQRQQLPPLNLKRISGSPNTQHRTFSSHGGVMASPTMSVNNEEYARKLSFNALMGVNVNHDSSMVENDEDWESIDEGAIIHETKKNSNKNNPEELENVIQRLTLENRNLKKRLKDIELGHDLNSIVAEDEKYAKLEDNYNELVQSYDNIENETKKLMNQNSSYYNDIESLRLTLCNKDEIISKFTSLTRCIIERLPNFIKQEETFNSLFVDSIGIGEIPEQINDCYLRTVEKFNLKTAKNTSKINESNLTDDDIIDMLKFDVKNLYSALLRSQNNFKNTDKNLNKKIQDERKTIIVSSLQSKLHSEFINENPDNKKIGLKNFKILNICSAQQEDNIDNDDDITTIQTPPNSMLNSNFNDSQMKKKFLSNSNVTTITPRTPLTPLSSGTSVDSFSPLKRLSIYSDPLDNLNRSDNDNDRLKSLDEENEEFEDDFFSTHSKARLSEQSLEMEYETFTT